jgi:probable F420-dependent oxidoreductase
MKYGVNLPISTHAATPATIALAAAKAEELGYDSLWVGDHVVMPTEPKSHYPYSADGKVSWDVEVPWLDPLMTLTWAAAATSRIGIGTAVLIVGMRPTLLVAKQLATLDQLSGGRLTVGVGVGWLEEEFELLGQNPANRGARMMEAIDVMRACWSRDVITYDGEFHKLRHPFAFQPKPVEGADLPLLIGASSDLAIRRIARIGAGWLPIETSPDEFRERVAMLDGELAKHKRSREGLRIVLQTDGPTFDREKAAMWASLGITEAFLEISWRANTVGGALDQLSGMADRLGIKPRAKL